MYFFKVLFEIIPSMRVANGARLTQRRAPGLTILALTPTQRRRTSVPIFILMRAGLHIFLTGHVSLTMEAISQRVEMVSIGSV